MPYLIIALLILAGWEIKTLIDATFSNRIAPYQNIISAMADTYQIPERLIKAVIFTESSGNPKADSGDSVGLMQVNFAGAVRLYGYTGTREQLFDPYTNIDTGTKILADAYSRFSTKGVDYVYAYYNDGRAVKNADGQFVNSKGDTIVQDHVNKFLKKYESV